MMSGIRFAKELFVESLITGAMGLPVGVPSPVVNKDHVAAGAYLCGHALHVISRGAEQIQARFGGIFGIIQDCSDRRSPPFFAAPADFMASVSNPSRMFPGDGFMSKLARTAWARLAYS